MIEVKKLTKKFGQITAVNDVTFEVKKGEVLGFLGPNGAGKSTTLKIIAGYLPPTDGNILIDDRDISEDLMVAKSKIGYMPESNPLYREMTTREFLSFAAEMHGVGNIDESVSKIILTANLKEVENQLIETLSKGYRTRLSFAAAIIHDPPILLLDEPTDGLDPNQKNEIRGLIKSLSREKAIIVSTHILEEVEAMCTKIAIISEGNLVLYGTPKDLRKHCETDKNVVISLSADHRENAESALSSNLIPLEKITESLERFRIEENYPIESVNSKLLNAKIPVEEIYYYSAPLDEAFRKLTRTKE